MQNDKRDKDRKWRWESDDIQPRDKKKQSQRREDKGRRVDANQLIRAGRFDADELYEE